MTRFTTHCFAFAAILCGGSSGCTDPHGDERAIIEAALQKTAEQAVNAVQQRCVKPEVIEYGDAGPHNAGLTIPASAVPEHLRLCTDDLPDSYYEVYLPEIGGDAASVNVDFQCGAVCGGGTSTGSIGLRPVGRSSNNGGTGWADAIVQTGVGSADTYSRPCCGRLARSLHSHPARPPSTAASRRAKCTSTARRTPSAMRLRPSALSRNATSRGLDR